MNQKALSTLEYTKIIAQLEEYASTSMGKKRCRELVPMNDLQEIKTAQAQTSDALARILRKGSISFSGAKDIRDSLLRLKVGSSLSIAELLRVSALLRVALRATMNLARKTMHLTQCFVSLHLSFLLQRKLTAVSSLRRRSLMMQATDFALCAVQ